MLRGSEAPAQTLRAQPARKFAHGFGTLTEIFFEFNSVGEKLALVVKVLALKLKNSAPSPVFFWKNP
jgi:hypothetical protein